MALRIAGFLWDEDNEEHVAAHGVGPEEVEEVFSGPRRIFRSRRGRYVALGHTVTGRYLMVVFRAREGGWIRPITARPMDRAERRRFDREVRA